MTTALAAPPVVTVPVVTPDQLELVRRTVAKDATPDELQLYLYDCARQGVHPLDKLIHFTKRSGKYTPVTSIDFMRTRAAESGEYAGNDDPRFNGMPGVAGFTAAVTVYRLVQGQRCAFSATARWTEYKPDADFMWQKMPHTMLGKCAEALALRKAFPKQLAGLYAGAELEQADPPPPPPVVPPAETPRRRPVRDKPISPPPPTPPPPEPSPPAASPPAKRLSTRDDHAPISRAQQKLMFARATEKHWSTDQLREVLVSAFGVDHSAELRRGDLDQLLTLIERGPSKDNSYATPLVPDEKGPF